MRISRLLPGLLLFLSLPASAAIRTTLPGTGSLRGASNARIPLIRRALIAPRLTFATPNSVAITLSPSLQAPVPTPSIVPVAAVPQVAKPAGLTAPILDGLQTQLETVQKVSADDATGIGGDLKLREIYSSPSRGDDSSFVPAGQENNGASFVINDEGIPIYGRAAD